MRLDHIAFRVAEGKRDEAAKFFIDAFGYKIQGAPFPIYFDDEHKDFALCVALEPPEKLYAEMPWQIIPAPVWIGERTDDIRYHLAPEVFISEGSPGSIVGEWVKSRGGVGGVHHLAYQVDNVEKTMREWEKMGWAQFSSDKPIKCDSGLTQVFSKPNVLGVVIELIHRKYGDKGFCEDNVKELMQKSKS